MKNFIFTDIDGVLNTVNRLEWKDSSIELYDKLCKEFNLKPVITSTWRTNHSIRKLQQIFDYQGVETPIHDFTPILTNEGRGAEIEDWLFKNTHNKFIIIDDNVRDINEYSLPNVIHCRGWVGFSEEDYKIAREILKKDE